MKNHLVSLIIILSMLIMFEGCKETPKINHPVINKTDASCLICHEKGLDGAPVTSHPKYADCMRCHKEAAGVKK